MLHQIKTAEALAPFRKVAASFCIQGCIYVQGQQRNAWHSTRVSYWYRGCSYFSDEAEVKAAAERARQRGSQLWYAEVPAVVVKHGNLALAVIQPASSRPFSDYVDSEPVPATVGDFAEAVARGASQTEIWHVDPAPSPWIDDYRVYHSSTQGAGLPLVWMPSRTQDIADFSLVVAGINEVLRSEA